MRQTWWVLGVLLILAGSSARGEVTVSREEYHGWEGAYRLSNGTVDLVFVPQIGRIMRYGYVGERNVLWENTALAGKTTMLKPPVTDWQNYGGDKLWPSPQATWGWPPDPVSDSGPQTVRVTPDKHLVVTGPASSKYGVQFQREIMLDSHGTRVTFRNVITNVGAKPVTWGIWEVAQVDSPDETRFPMSSKGGLPGGYKVFEDQKPAQGQVTIQEDMVTIRRRADHSGKIGTRSTVGWIESRWGERGFKIAGIFPTTGDYPDGGCSQEIYTSDDPNRYVEMELLAPVRTFGPGKEESFVTAWSLTRPR
ncbi:MAG: hypothetical protein JWN14_4148 [Chthonomonadales bacterium]|nr:hypothetical protein [Chthonomonadales bacterium]